MPKIKILPQQLADMIAAGEVVERPASVVKELVENSIDAHAKRIVVEIEQGGKDLIRVTDDGVGMDREDAGVAFVRHATSKINSVQDLNNIHTLGFRGEALASIAAVSYVTLKSRTAGAIEGTSVYVKTGRVEKIEATGFSMGTQIEIKHLFINLPARKKFLKTEATEYSHISKTMTYFALSHEEIAFKFVNNGKEIFDLPKSKNLIERIGLLLGNELTDDLLPVYYGGETLKINGYIGIPEIARRNRLNQYVMLNGREIYDSILSKSIFEGYHSLLPKEKYPMFIVRLTVDPRFVDVNVHPRKLEVKFLNQQQVFETMRMAVKDALEKNMLIPLIKQDSPSPFNIHQIQQPSSYEFEKRPLSSSSPPESFQSTSFRLSDKVGEPLSGFAALSNYEKTSSAQETGSLPPLQDLSKMSAASKRSYLLARHAMRSSLPNQGQIQSALQFTQQLSAAPSMHDAQELWRTNMPPLRATPLVQLNNSYILASDSEGLMIIDQHAAHERILYTKLMQGLGQGQMLKQQLLTAFQIEVSYREATVLEPNLQLLHQIGFEIESFGHRTFIVNAIPVSITKENLDQVIRGIIDDLLEERPSAEVTRREEIVLTSIACRSAIMFGKELTVEEQTALLQQLDTLPQKFTCPHGRPTIIKMTFEELERKFGRK